MRTREHTYRYLHKIGGAEWATDIPLSEGLKEIYMSRVEQRAIPWCVIHRTHVVGPVDYCPLSEDQYPRDGYDCVISTGGPNHKWWEDLDEN